MYRTEVCPSGGTWQAFVMQYVVCVYNYLFVFLQGNGLKIEKASEEETGIYACYLDNFVQPVVSYKFSLIVEG